MNIQAMMKQAQKLQKDMLKEKEEIDNQVFTTQKSFVSVEMTGAKKLQKVKIDLDSCEKEDIEMLEDVILVAVNDVINQIDEETNKRMGKYTQGMPGLF